MAQYTFYRVLLNLKSSNFYLEKSILKLKGSLGIIELNIDRNQRPGKF